MLNKKVELAENVSFLIRYEQQCKDLKTKGFFMTDDGQRSCDVIVKKKVKKVAAVVKPKMKERGT